jgi:acetate kinase
VAGGNPARLATGLVKMTADAHHIAVHDPADGITHEARWAASGPFHAVALRHVLDLRRAAFPDANVAAAAHRVVHRGLSSGTRNTGGRRQSLRA